MASFNIPFVLVPIQTYHCWS